jgi:hypothetical protein
MENQVEEKLEDQQVELSQEELDARRKKLTTFYKDNIKHLTIQLEYEQLLTSIEENRAKRLQAQMFIAEAYASQQEDPSRTQARDEFNEAMDTVSKRKLKQK